MKTKLLLGAFLLCFFAPQIIKAQPFNVFSGNYGETTTTTSGIGIGNFSVTGGATATSARLHVNNFFCNAPTGALNGLLFRTDGSNAVENNWKLFTGATNGALTEKFRLAVPASTNNVLLNTVQAGYMGFLTTNAERMRITDAGLVGIGSNTPTIKLEVFQTTGPQLRLRQGNGAFGGFYSDFETTSTGNLLINPSNGLFFGNDPKVGINIPSGTNPQSVLHLNVYYGNPIYTQTTNTNTGLTVNDGLRIGIAATGDAELRQQEDLDIGIFTAAAGTQRMVIKGVPGATQGFVGIGSGFTAPQHLLDVRNGDINTGNGTAASPQGYRIGGNFVLRHKADISSIFVGVGAGTNTTGVNNTFVGNDAGNSNVNGDLNTFIGSRTGFTNTSGRGNTFIGRLAGFTNNGNWNTFTGTRAGELNTTGSTNCFYGKEAGLNNLTGNSNCFYGNHSGFSNTSGNGNVCMGEFAANSTTIANQNVIIGTSAGYNSGAFAADDYNVYIGSSAGYNSRGDYNVIIGGLSNSSVGLNNAIAIGANTVVTASNKMILGDNTVWVGIGLSNDPTPTFGPQNSLEINARNNTTGAIIANKSGLRFRQLTSASPALTPNGKVLTVDASGDVILVPDQTGGGGGGIGTCASPTTFTAGANGAINLTNNNNYGIGV